MSGTTFSLLYPDEASLSRHTDPDARPRIGAHVTAELGLDEIFGLKASRLCDFFTSDPELIRYRQQMFADLLALPSLREVLAGIYPTLSDIRELRQLEDDTGAAESYLYSITEIELYVSCVDRLVGGLVPLRDRLHSTALCRLSDFIRDFSEGEEYRELTKKLSALSERVREVRSITVGVNLDAQLRPESAGVLSVNAEKFKSGKVLDKILRLSFRNDAFTCIAPLSAIAKEQSDNKKEAMSAAFHAALEDVFRSSVRGWRNIVGEYVLDNTDFLLRLLPEIEFVCRASDVIDRLRAHPGCHVCLPDIRPREERAFATTGLYNPRVALTISEPIVENDLALDEDGRIFILTGPNRGGKSVITVAMGAAQAMFQLGLPIPARTGALSPADGIYTHFPEGADDTIDKGRLGEECQRLREIFDAVSRDSMILLDESLSSTGAYEASYIAQEVLTAFAVVGCRGIFSTHLHELAAAKDHINERSVALHGVRVDTLVAGMEAGERSFKIRRTTPDGHSYARDIADRYGLSFDSLLADAQEKANIP